MSFAKWTYPDNAPSTSATWKNGWIEVRRANIMLENVPTVASLDEATKNHWLGVARLMRAWQYYHLVRMYGNLPWIDKALNINDEGEIIWQPRGSGYGDGQSAGRSGLCGNQYQRYFQ